MKTTLNIVDRLLAEARRHGADAGSRPSPPGRLARHVVILIDTSIRVDHLRRGIGYVDAHLPASASIDRLRLWTRDKSLPAQSVSLGLAFTP